MLRGRRFEDSHAGLARQPRRGEAIAFARPRRTGTMKGRLNLFQAAMLRWRASYPYNAVHVAELPGDLDHARLSKAIDDHLSHVGVARM